MRPGPRPEQVPGGAPLRRWRGAALVPAAALAVHQLRYVLAYGSQVRDELAEQGHSYLHTLTPWIVLALGVAFGAFLGRLAEAWRDDAGEPSPRRRLAGLWLVAAAGLLGVYAAQEWLEGLFATGHPTGLQGIFGGGGLWAIPSALAVGGVLALLVRGARALLDRVARAGRTAPVAARAPLLTPGRRRPQAHRPRVAPLATAAAGRAPPAGAEPPAIGRPRRRAAPGARPTGRRVRACASPCPCT